MHIGNFVEKKIELNYQHQKTLPPLNTVGYGYAVSRMYLYKTCTCGCGNDTNHIHEV